MPPDFAESLSVIYFPQLGYLINVPYKEGVTDPEVCEQIGWEFQVSRNARAEAEERETDEENSSLPRSTPTSKATSAGISIAISGICTRSSQVG